MTEQRVVLVTLAVLCAIITYASVQYPTKMDDPIITGAIGAIGLAGSLLLFGWTFLRKQNHNHN